MKKMFDQSVIESDDFLDLPMEAQLLYIHLNFEGDADGFVENVVRAIRTCGVGKEALECLVEKGFLIRFNSKLVVITHWWVNNQMRRDRYTPTKHQYEMERLTRGENGEYLLIEKMEADKQFDAPKAIKDAITDAIEADRLRYEDLGLSREMADEARKWARYKKERGEPITETQLKSYISNLKGYVRENSEADAIKSIEESMSNGYKGVVWKIKKAEKARAEQKKQWQVESRGYDMDDLESRLLAN